jgi:5-(carboxyamino)imidazole ribonucleotide mutase
MNKVVSPSKRSPVRVGILMGSDSDLETMRAAADALAEFGVGCELRVISAHRTPEVAHEYATEAAARGLQVIICGAGVAAHLAGVIAASTSLPVIGVPIASGPLNGVDALLSTVQMPPGIPVATVGIGNVRNAGLLAVRILAASDARLRTKLDAFAKRLADGVREKDAAVREKFPPG